MLVEIQHRDLKAGWNDDPGRCRGLNVTVRFNAESCPLVSHLVISQVRFFRVSSQPPASTHMFEVDQSCDKTTHCEICKGVYLPPPSGQPPRDM